jgi:hypothetical protein
MLVKMRDDSQDDDGDDDDDDTWNRRPVPPARHRIGALSPRPGLSRPGRSPVKLPRPCPVSDITSLPALTW